MPRYPAAEVRDKDYNDGTLRSGGVDGDGIYAVLPH